MKKIIIFFIFIIFILNSCTVLKRQVTVKTPETVDELKEAETEAKKLYDEGRYKEAIEYLQALLKKDPKNPVYWNQLGSVYAQLNSFDNAIISFKNAIKYDPKNIKAMYNLGLVYSEKGSKKEARKVIEDALKIAPKNPLLQAALGNVLIDEENYDKAEKIYEQIVAVKPDFDIGHFNLGVINYQKRELKEAKKNYEEVLKINPNDIEAKENLAAIYILDSDYENAIKYLKEVIDSNPQDDITLENAYYNLGIAYLRMGKFQEAFSAFESALEIEPWDMAAYVNAAILAEKLGYKDKAIKYWQKYDRLLPINKRKKEIRERLQKLGVKIELTPIETKQIEPEPTSSTNGSKIKK
ncbi:MAG: tetratricopeptide repeat protein [Candidatus Goldbacteria bacterium]|nr:tetratricopeptide repeat protein [Candidatus Goldiibacteriota bacterium]